MSSGWDYNGLADAQGEELWYNSHVCPVLVSNPNEGLLSPLGYIEVGADAWWGGQFPDGNYYYFDGPGNLAQMDPGTPYGRNYYTRAQIFITSKIIKSFVLVLKKKCFNIC